MARTITSPGVQITETDLSNYQDIPRGTTVFVPGFAPQGPTDETILITSISELERVYGTPETAAERYFYHTAKEILNSPATLLTSRLPYGSGSGEGFADQYSALIFPTSLNVTSLSGTGALSATVVSTTSALRIDKPKYITLTEDEYELVVQGDFSWSSLGSSNNASFTTDNDPVSGGLTISGGIVVINSSKTAINEQFEGYYISFADNQEFGPETDFTAVNKFYSLSGTTDYAILPQTRLGFALSASKESYGSNSLSEVVEGSVNFNINQSYYNDTLILNVFKVRNSIYEPQVLTFSVAETHIGSLDENKKDIAQVAGIRRSLYLQNKVNNSSSNIKLFVNPNISEKLNWANSTDNDPAYRVEVLPGARAVFPNSVYMPRFNFENDKHVGNVISKLTRSLTFIETNETIPLDIVVDGGLSTIYTVAQTQNGFYNENVATNYISLSSPTDEQVMDFKSVFSVFDNFVTNTRKDCVFISDPLRQVFINGENTKIFNLKDTTFTQNIFVPLKNLYNSANSNYSVTYGNWVKSYDQFSDKQVWLPFSGFAAAAYARTDAFAQPWVAPAGLTRGIVSNVVDIAFNPNQKQRDFLYNISINPVVFFSGDGYVIFGQKTLQNKPSAFDRVNVRRLFLVLERATQAALKYFVFEPNTEFTRTRLKSTIVPIFELARDTEGLYDYLIVCDERNNTPDLIDRNELAVDIYIKPVKAAEFVLVNFIATRTGQDFAELI
jgi:hypothetical protein